MTHSQLSLDVYRMAVEHTPVLCVDVVLRALDGRYVLFKRNNEPLKGQPWVCGGRVYKEEPCLGAAVRKLREEVGLDADPDLLRFVGYYEEVFEFSFFGRGKYHTVSLVYELDVPVDPAALKLDGQHSEVVLSAALPSGLTNRLFTNQGPVR